MFTGSVIDFPEDFFIFTPGLRPRFFPDPGGRPLRFAFLTTFLRVTFFLPAFFFVFLLSFFKGNDILIGLITLLGACYLFFRGFENLKIEIENKNSVES